MFGRNFEKLFNELLSLDPYLNGDNWERKHYKSEDGSISFTYITNKRGDLNKQDEVSLLKQKLKISVDEQNFEEAVELRDKIKNLEKNKEELIKLNKELDECVKKQDFENAIKLRDKIKELK
jgi:protein-arginine kinase activator protein McsA